MFEGPLGANFREVDDEPCKDSIFLALVGKEGVFRQVGKNVGSKLRVVELGILEHAQAIGERLCEVFVELEMTEYLRVSDIVVVLVFDSVADRFEDLVFNAGYLHIRLLLRDNVDGFCDAAGKDEYWSREKR